MAIEQTRTKIIASVWQAVAQSKIDLSPIPKEQQNQMVEKIADEMMVTLDQLLEEAMDAIDEEDASPTEVEEPEDEFAEVTLWKGRPFLSLVEQYTITNERIKISRGMVGRKVENFELIRVQDIDFKQNVSERVFGIGDITIRGSDSSQPEIILRNIPKPEGVYEILRRAWLEARKRHGLQFREYM
jgi:hypothetical protein